MMKSQIPSTKLQIMTEYSITQIQNSFGNYDFENCNLFVIWNL